jgi:hypothetical protein
MHIDCSLAHSKLVQFICDCFLIPKDEDYNILFKTSNNEFIWKLSEKPLSSLPISAEDKIYFVPHIISSLIILRSSNVVQELINIDLPVISNCQFIHEHFNFEFYEGFTFYPIDSSQSIPVDFEKRLIEETCQVYQLRLLRRFYVFRFTFFSSEESIGYLYFESKYHVLNNNIIVNESTGLELALLSIFSDFSIPTNFISFIDSLDISSLIPKSFLITTNLIKKFKTLCCRYVFLPP